MTTLSLRSYYESAGYSFTKKYTTSIQFVRDVNVRPNVYYSAQSRYRLHGCTCTVLAAATFAVLLTPIYNMMM